ncbi:MAG: PAS domain S-box protein [Elusimicrobiota bacterium]
MKNGFRPAGVGASDRERGLERLEKSRSAPRKSESELRTIIDNVPGLIAYLDRSLRLRFVNGRYEELFGLPKENALGRRFRSLIGAAAFSANRASIRRALHGERVLFECFLPRRGGSWWGLVTLLPDLAAGRSRGFFVLAQDLSGPREQLRLIVESAPTGILVVDRTGRIVLVNARLEAIFGYKRQALLGKPMEVLVPHGLRARHRRARRSYFADAQTRMMDRRGMPFEAGRTGPDFPVRTGVRRNGTTLPLEVTLVPIRSGHSMLTMATIVDITESVKAREDETMRDRERVQRDLLARFSHELKTPIATLRVAADTLLRLKLSGSKDGAGFLATIATQTERLSTLVDNLIQLTALERTERSPRSARFSLSKLVRGCVGALACRLKEKKVALRARMTPGIYARGDVDGVRQAIENLLDNAIHYNRPGGRVDVSLRRAGGRARLAVQDTGVGIAKSEFPKLFQRFHRTRRAKRLSPSGSGLGLAIVKRVVEDHGGRISVRSRSGRGSRFDLSIPAA